MEDEPATPQPSFLDRSSPFAFHVRKEALTREFQIAIEGQKLVRDRLAECFRTEGVNQFVECKELRLQYMALCNDRFKGMVFPEDAQPNNRRVLGVINSVLQ